MKKLFLLPLLIVILMPQAEALDTLRLESTVKDVTVFFEGAQVQREATLNIDRGARIVMLAGLPPDIVQSSIQVKNVNGCKILSVRSSVVPVLDDDGLNESKRYDSLIEQQTLKMKTCRNKISVYEREERILLDNSKLGTAQTGVKISELKEAADFFRTRLNDIRSAIFELENDINSMTDETYRLYAAKNRIEAMKGRLETRLYITLDAESKLKDKIVFTYYITKARWTPSYDFRVSDVNEPLVLVYLANVVQTSGEDWKDVKIKLSASNPTLSSNKPELPVWFAYSQPQRTTQTFISTTYNTMPSAENSGSVQGKIKDTETGEPIPFANIVIESGGRQVNGTSSDIDGHYRINPVPAGVYNLKVTSIGYKPIEIRGLVVSVSRITFKDVQLAPTAELLTEFIVSEYSVPLIDKSQTTSGGTMTAEEIRRIPGAYSHDGEIGSVRGSRTEGTVTYIDGVRVRGSSGYADGSHYVRSGSTPASYGDATDVNNLIDNVLKTSVAHLEYQIETPYTIKSDGEEYLIRIKEAKLPVQYAYNIVPKKERDAFLTAAIPDWVPLNLMDGRSSIYFQGTFVGETFLDTRVMRDTLDVSLGRDKGIFTDRVYQKEFSERVSMGSNYKQYVGWKISVRNNKKYPVSIILEENYPLSDYKTYVVELIELSGGKVDVNKGKITWEFVLMPSDTKEILFRYSVKYPKNQILYFD